MEVIAGYAETLEALIADDNYSPRPALHEIENHPEKYGSFETRICRQTLYAYIDKGVFLRLTNKALPFKGSRRKKKTKHVQRAKQQPKGESIEKRPPEIDGRPGVRPLGNGSGGFLQGRA